MELDFPLSHRATVPAKIMLKAVRQNLAAEESEEVEVEAAAAL